MKFPKFLRKKLSIGDVGETLDIIKENKIFTVCTEANCPNKFECFSKKTATFLALGKICTRSCAFCDVDFGEPKPLDKDEPKNIAKACRLLNLKHIVITMVTRDDLEDKGASHIAQIIFDVKKLNPASSIEILTSDFSCRFDLIDIVLDQRVDIFNYNIETVKRISPKIRHIATYENSLKILKYVKETQKTKFVKSGFMVGLSETKTEVFQTIKDLHNVGVDIITIGQYLSPNKKKYPIKSFITPEEFNEYKDFARKLGAKNIYAEPYVRSSYNANIVLKKASFK